jgi:hypothetical protein
LGIPAAEVEIGAYSDFLAGDGNGTYSIPNSIEKAQ